MRGNWPLLLAGLAGASALSWGPFRSPVASKPGAAASPAVLRTPADATSRSGISSVRAVAEPLSTAATYQADLEERMNSYIRERGGDTLIRRVLIANNGMAATKTIMSIRKWAYKTFGDENAIEFIVMASAEDLAANAEFIRRANEFVEVPAGSNANNYANVQLIVDLCVSQNV
ncbi:acetyl-CoA carboxylase, partial [Emiliania huxleyi CCMP1516]|uniref:Biotin carboxylation domain-containing protein n=3 Tax=Emiliania huxleyi TaxID=2903 RepID=A0A0D3KJ44_EMIH1